MPRRIWSEMTSDEIRDADTSGWVGIVPLAAIEQHGPHLPLVTDSCIGAGLLALALDAMPDDLPLTVLPMLEIGKSSEHEYAQGTLSFDTHTMLSGLIQTAEGAIRAGLGKLVFINSHGGNSALLDIVTRDLRNRHGVLAVATSWQRFGVPEGLVPDEELAFGIHGGLVETSLMLFMRPDLVRVDLAEDFGSLQEELVEENDHLRAYGAVQFGWVAEDLNPAGVVGNAAAGSAEIGRAIAQHQAAGFAKLCEEVNRFDIEKLTGPVGGASLGKPINKK